MELNNQGPEQNTQSNTLSQKAIFNPKLIRRGVALFLIITILAFTGIFFYNDGLASLKLWTEINIVYIVLGLIFIFNDLYIGGLRNHIFVREFVPGISQRVCFDANLANIFMGAVTPMQSGGGPAQWYILHRNGVSIADIVGVSFYNWLSTLIFFPITGALALYILKDNVPEGFVLQLTRLGFSVFTTLLVVILLALFAPALIEWLIGTIAKIIGKLNHRWGNKVAQSGQNGIEKLAEYREKYLGLIKQKPHLMVWSFLLTIILYFNKYALAYIFVLAFGLNIAFWPIIAVMAVSYLLLYFAPSPGGSGIAELGITALLVPLVGADLAPSITLLHRSFLIFLPALLGAIVVLGQLKKDAN